MSIHFDRARDSLNRFDFQRLFVEELGWNRPARTKVEELDVKGTTFRARHVAELAVVVVLEVESADGSVPDAKTRAAVH
jgi:hypothetical protein